MAPHQADGSNAAANIETVNAQMRAVVEDLYFIMVQAMNHQGTATERTMQQQMRSLIQNLLSVSQTAPMLNVQLPPELIQYVQSSRNPDIFTRDFVESTMKYNQDLKGKTQAFGQFRDVLAKAMVAHMDGVDGDVHRIIESTGGSIV